MWNRCPVQVPVRHAHGRPQPSEIAEQLANSTVWPSISLSLSGLLPSRGTREVVQVPRIFRLTFLALKSRLPSCIQL